MTFVSEKYISRKRVRAYKKTGLWNAAMALAIAAFHRPLFVISHSSSARTRFHRYAFLWQTKQQWQCMSAPTYIAYVAYDRFKGWGRELILVREATLSEWCCLHFWNVIYSKRKELAHAGLCGSVGWASDWWSGGSGFGPRRIGNILSWRLIMKYFLWSFSSFLWFKKGSCQFLAKECAQYWLTV